MDNDAKLIDSAEIEELQDRIEALESDQAMDAGVLDGYLTAQALNPLKPEDDDVLPFIFSDSGDPAALPNDDRLLELLKLRAREIRSALNAGAGLDPVIFPLVDENDEEILDGDGIEAVVPWCAGFMMGVQQWPDAAIEDEEVQTALLPIAARMAAEGDELDDETLTLWEAAKADQMVDGVFTLKTLLVPNRPVRRNEPRVGRNDPCPCGSNKKFKQCCGKKA